jgi:hypothetical protein
MLMATINDDSAQPRLSRGRPSGGSAGGNEESMAGAFADIDRHCWKKGIGLIVCYRNGLRS